MSLIYFLSQTFIQTNWSLYVIVHYEMMILRSFWHHIIIGHGSSLIPIVNSLKPLSFRFYLLNESDSATYFLEFCLIFDSDSLEEYQAVSQQKEHNFKPSEQRNKPLIFFFFIWDTFLDVPSLNNPLDYHKKWADDSVDWGSRHISFTRHIQHQHVG